MSASKNSTRSTSEILDRKAEARAEEQRKNRKFKMTAIAVVVVLVVMIVFVAVINSSFMYTKLTAVQVGDTSYSAAEYSYYAKSMYNQFYNNYGYSVDTTTAIYQDENGNDVTWGEYFKQSARDMMVETTGMYKKAMAAGYTLTEDDKAQIESNIQYIDLYASTNGVSTDKYLAMSYCKGMNTELFREIITRYYTAVSYASSINEGFSYDASELEAYYQENAADLNNYSIRYYAIFSNGDAFSAIEGDEAKAQAAHDAAAEIAAAASEEEFAQNVYSFAPESSKETYADTDATLYSFQGNTLNSIYKDWVIDAARQPLDTEVFDTDSGSYAVMFIGMDDNHYSTKNVRHILIQAEADSEGNITDEAKAQAEEEMNKVLDLYNADPTEDNFQALVAEYSDDNGSNTKGGLYENIYKGEMVDKFDEFCFGDRSYGDVDVVYESNSSYTGYHIIFFVSDGMVYSDYLAQEAKRTSDYNAWLSDATSGLEAVEKFGARFVTL